MHGLKHDMGAARTPNVQDKAPAVPFRDRIEIVRGKLDNADALANEIRGRLFGYQPEPGAPVVVDYIGPASEGLRTIDERLERLLLTLRDIEEQL